ncbi:MAG: hypothetical protein ABII82_18375 [Verrucomicrobiota bacterium]
MSPLRVVTWNCRQGFDAKADALLALQPDIAVVPESHQHPKVAETSLFGGGVPHLWAGSLTNKGLGLFAPSAEALIQIEPVSYDDAGDFGLAAVATHVNGPTKVIGVWTVPANQGPNRYLTAAQRIMRRYENVLSGGDTIVAGDLNVSGKTDPRGMQAFAAMLHDRFGLVSAYHAFHGVKIGDEKDDTLWWRGHETEGYHCDFVFVPTKWRIVDVQIGAFAEWGSFTASARSDHAPVIVTLEK